MRRVIDTENWARRDYFRYYEGFANPFFSLTTEVACGPARETARLRGESFFLYYLYAILRAVNGNEAFRYRLEGGNFGEIVLYDTVDVLTPIRIDGEGRFRFVRIPYLSDREEFLSAASQLVAGAPCKGEPYEENSAAAGGPYDLVLVSAVPDLFFSSVTVAQKHRQGSDYPIFTVGRAVERGNGPVLPLALSFHHGFVDGFHVAQFVAEVERSLAKGF